MPDHAPRALLLDLDGTIADTLPLIFDCFRHAIAPWVSPLPDDEAIEATFGPPERECLAVMVPKPHLDEAEGRFYEFYERHHGARVRLAEGLDRAIDHAQKVGWKVGVLTNKGRRSTRFTLETLGLLEHLGCVISGEDVEDSKPDPEGLRRAAGLLGVQPARVLMVGDSPSDINAARNAGAISCAVTWAARHADRIADESPDHICGDADQLIALIDALQAA